MSTNANENGRANPSTNSMANALSYVFQFLSPSKDVDNSPSNEVDFADTVVPDLRFASVNGCGIDALSSKNRNIPSRVVVLFARRRSGASCLLTRHERGWWMPFLAPKPDESNLDAAMRLLKMVGCLYVL